MNENLTILRKGLILILIPFLTQLAFIGLLFKTIGDNRRAQSWSLHSKDVIGSAETTFRKLIEIHSDTRGYVLTGNSTFRERVERQSRLIAADFRLLEKLVNDNEVQKARVQKLSQTAQRLAAWQQETIKLVAEKNQKAAIEHVQDLSGNRILDEFRAEVEEFFQEESRLEAERARDLARSMRQQQLSLIAGSVLAVLGVVVLGTIFARGITRRFAMLAENARRLGEGKDLINPLTGRDEIAHLDRVLHRMARALVEKNRENEMFIYSVSHDLRSPLVNLQGFSQELGYAAQELRQIGARIEVSSPDRQRVLKIVDEDINGSIKFIRTAVSRLSSIIDALLRLSRAGRLEYRWQLVDMKTIVTRIVEALQSTIVEKKAEIIVGELPQIWGDPTAVDQLFANLIVNAVNYLDPLRPGVIEIGVLDPKPQSTVTIYVKDNGRGIPEAGLPKLFHAFQRFHDGVARGEGIGLALVRRIVERHGGRIRVESKVGVGTTFYVELMTDPHGDPFGASQFNFDTKEGFQ